MNIVFFSEAMTLILKLTRIMMIDRSHAILIGLGGSGRSILTRMASFVKEMRLFETDINQNSKD